jgi:pimeloyl-ACP methyl ester carboxylesterase
MRLRLIAILMYGLATWAAPGHSVATGTAVPIRQADSPFRVAPCEDVVEPVGHIAIGFDDDTRCGWLSVPEQHANPAGPKIELGVVVLTATGNNPRPDPLFMAQGGPGGSTIDAYAAVMRDNPIRRQRDIVLFDQRGTRNSRPDLACPELDQLTLDTIEIHVPPDEAHRRSLAALLVCRRRLVGEGIDLSAFDSAENAADVNALSEALGYEKINFYGVSYGTLLAQHVLRDFPDILRSVILDAVVPARTNPNVESGRSEDRALTELFGACARDARCNAAYPDLERTYFETVLRLDHTPARVPMTDFESGKVYDAVVDGEALQSVVFQALYATGLLPYLPYIMAQTGAGNYAALGNIASLFVFDRSIRAGMYYSVMCAEDADYDPAEGTSGINRPQIAERTDRDLKALLDACRQWDVEWLGTGADEPVSSDVPALLLSGSFDPITPPANAEEVARGLSLHRLFTFPNTGHGAFRSSPCADRIVYSFLNDPNARPDSRCLADLQPLTFATRDDIVPVPSLAPLLSLAPHVRVSLGLFGLGLAFLLLSWLVLPLSWLARKALKREGGPLPTMARLMPWLVLLNGLILAAFAGAVFWQLLTLVSAEADFIYVFGLPASTRPIFLLPIASAMLAVLIVFGVVIGWRSGGWGWLRRINRALLAGASITCIVALIMLGMFVAPFLG